MVPASYLRLTALPLTPNEKIDRRALPPPEVSRPVLDGVHVAPRSDTERCLAAMWRELLVLERVGINDNFFELGGHSLLGSQLSSRVRAAFHVEVPLRTLFDAPTVAGLAVAHEAEHDAARPAKPSAIS